MQCLKCGEQLKENSKFCTKCGAVVESGQDLPSDVPRIKEGTILNKKPRLSLSGKILVGIILFFISNIVIYIIQMGLIGFNTFSIADKLNTVYPLIFLVAYLLILLKTSLRTEVLFAFFLICVMFLIIVFVYSGLCDILFYDPYASCALVLVVFNFPITFLFFSILMLISGVRGIKSSRKKLAISIIVLSTIIIARQTSSIIISILVNPFP